MSPNLKSGKGTSLDSKRHTNLDALSFKNHIEITLPTKLRPKWTYPLKSTSTHSWLKPKKYFNWDGKTFYKSCTKHRKTVLVYSMRLSRKSMINLGEFTIITSWSRSCNALLRMRRQPCRYLYAGGSFRITSLSVFAASELCPWISCTILETIWHKFIILTLSASISPTVYSCPQPWKSLKKTYLPKITKSWKTQVSFFQNLSRPRRSLTTTL